MNDPNDPNDIPVVYVTLDEAPDPTADEIVWTKLPPHRADSGRVGELAEQMKSGQWHLPQLDEGSAAAAGPAYADRQWFLDPNPIGRDEADQLLAAYKGHS